VKEKSTFRKIPQIILSIYALLYLAYIILPIIPVLDITAPEEPAGRQKTIISFIAFFLVYLLSWRNRDLAGMLLITGYIASILADALLENLRLEALILGLPVMILGILMVRDWYRQLLNLLASIYTLYQIWRTITYFVVIEDLALLDWLLISGLLAVWIFGYILVWKRPAFAGWIFIFWFLALMGTVVTDRGGLEYPLAAVIIGLPGLILGILFILLGRKQKRIIKSQGEQSARDP
jgi:hypothetical protein